MSDPLSREEAAEMMHLLLDLEHRAMLSRLYPTDVKAQMDYRNVVARGWRMWQKLSQPQNLGLSQE